MNKRVDLELVRIVAIVCVLINHTATNTQVSKAIFNSGEGGYYFYLFLASASRVAVPLFFMVSGALLINKKEEFSIIIKRRIVKYIVIIIVFSVVQFLFHARMGYVSLTMADIKNWLHQMYTDSVIVPYWFLYAYLSILIMLPFLRKMVVNLEAKEFNYLIVLHLLFVGILPMLESFIGISHINLSIPLACETSIFFFIIGNYMDKQVNVTSRSMFLLIFASVLCICISTVDAYMSISRLNVFEDGTQYPFRSNLICIPAITVFLISKKSRPLYSNKHWISKIIILFGGASFGIYLCESIFDTISFEAYFWANKIVTPFFSWLIWVGADYIFGALIVIVVKRIINRAKKTVKYVMKI